MSNFHSKPFKFAFSSEWPESELLGKFRARVKKDETLFTNNLLGMQQPIKMLQTFEQLNAYINSFNFELVHWPLYFSLAIGLMQSYRNNKNVDYAISFQAFWNVTPNKTSYLGKYELPVDNTIYWVEKITPKNEFNPNFINSNKNTTPLFQVDETPSIDMSKFNNLDQLVNSLKENYFFDSFSRTFFEYQKEMARIWSPLKEDELRSKIFQFYSATDISVKEVSNIINYLKPALSKESSQYFCKMSTKIIDLRNQNDVTKSVKKDDLVVFHTPLNVIKIDYNTLMRKYPHFLN